MDQACRLAIGELEVELSCLELGLTSFGATGTLDVSVHEEVDERPDDMPIVSYSVQVPSTPELAVIDVSGGTLLRAGEFYWVVVRMASQGHTARWLGGWEALTPLSSWCAERTPGGRWHLKVSPGGPGPAHRVWGSRSG